jgi:hypothetical protein
MRRFKMQDGDNEPFVGLRKQLSDKDGVLMDIGAWVEWSDVAGQVHGRYTYLLPLVIDVDIEQRYTLLWRGY